MNNVEWKKEYPIAADMRALLEYMGEYYGWKLEGGDHTDSSVLIPFGMKRIIKATMGSYYAKFAEHTVDIIIPIIGWDYLNTVYETVLDEFDNDELFPFFTWTSEGLTSLADRMQWRMDIEGTEALNMLLNEIVGKLEQTQSERRDS